MRRDRRGERRERGSTFFTENESVLFGKVDMAFSTLHEKIKER
jgi:hypothetical protein